VSCGSAVAEAGDQREFRTISARIVKFIIIRCRARHANCDVSVIRSVAPPFIASHCSPVRWASCTWCWKKETVAAV